MKNARLYALIATVPLLAFFFYQSVFVLPHRPTVPDPAHGYIYILDCGGPAVRYISNQDFFGTFGAFFGAFILVWCAGSFRRENQAGA